MTEIEESYIRSTVSCDPVVFSGINLRADIEKYRKLIDEWVHSYWLCRSCIQLLTDDNWQHTSTTLFCSQQHQHCPVLDPWLTWRTRGKRFKRLLLHTPDFIGKGLFFDHQILQRALSLCMSPVQCAPLGTYTHVWGRGAVDRRNCTTSMKLIL